jgi:hypothetical protein
MQDATFCLRAARRRVLLRSVLVKSFRRVLVCKSFRKDRLVVKP